MQFQLTQQGQIAATNAKGAGIKLVFGDFTVGSAFGYTPQFQGETGLHGTLLYTGQITNYGQTAAGNLQFQMILDNTVGDFSYGEMAIWLADGTLFALGALPALQQKYATPSLAANQVVETCQLVLNAGVPTIQWVATPLTVGSIPEVANYDLLVNPTASTSNALIIHTKDDYGNDAIVFTQGSSAGTWEISTHQYKVYNDTVEAATTGSNTFFGHTSPNLGTFPYGRYLIQFTSGASKGLIRVVTAVSGNQITMDTAMGIATGDSFNVYQSTCSFIAAQATPFTPVQQGGGIGQLATKVYIGDNGAGGLSATVGTTNLGNFVFEAELAADIAAINTALAGKQPVGNYQIALGYTPVQQGGGASQLSNKVYIGWDGGGTRIQIDASDQGRIAMQNQLAAVATTGQYSSLLGIPSFATVAFTGSYTNLVNVPSFATVAFTGNYNDLINKPVAGGGPAQITTIGSGYSATVPARCHIHIWVGDGSPSNNTFLYSNGNLVSQNSKGGGNGYGRYHHDHGIFYAGDNITWNSSGSIGSPVHMITYPF